MFFNCQELFIFFLTNQQIFRTTPCQSRLESFIFLPYLSATCIIIHVFLVFVNTKFDFLFFYTKGVLIKSTRLYIHMVAAQRFELRTLRVWTACSSQLSYAASGGQGWIRTIVIRRWQIYSLFPLTTRAPTHNGDPGGTRTPDPLIRSQIL